MLAGIIIIGILILIYLLYWWKYSRRAAALLAEVEASGAPTSYSKYMEKQPVRRFEPNLLDRALQQISIADEATAQEKLADQSVIHEFVNRQIREQKPELWEQAKAVIAKHSVILSELEEAAAQGKLPAPAGGPGSSDTRFQYLTGLRSILFMVVSKALLHARQNDSNQAITSLQLGFQIAELLKDEPTIMSQAMRIAALKIMFVGLAECLEMTDFNEAQSKQLDETLANVDLHGSIKAAYETERAYALDLIRNASILKFSPFYHANVANYLEYMRGVINGTNLSFQEARERGLLNPQPRVPAYATLLSRVAPIYANMSATIYLTESAIACARVFVAIQLCRVKVGNYPQSLEESAAQTGWTLPLDPLTNAPLNYQATSDGFTLSSNCPEGFQCPKIEAKRVSVEECRFIFDTGGVTQPVSDVLQDALDQEYQQTEQPEDEQ